MYPAAILFFLTALIAAVSIRPDTAPAPGEAPEARAWAVLQQHSGALRQANAAPGLSGDLPSPASATGWVSTALPGYVVTHIAVSAQPATIAALARLAADPGLRPPILGPASGATVTDLAGLAVTLPYRFPAGSYAILSWRTP